MPFTLRPVPRTGNIYRYEQYRHDSRDERNRHRFASFCYECYERHMGDLPRDVGAGYSVRPTSDGHDVTGASGGDSRQTVAIDQLKDSFGRSLRKVSMACALDIVEYLKRHDGYIDSWPQAKIHVASDEWHVADGGYADGATTAEASEYLKDKVYFTFSFPKAEVAIPPVYEERQLAEEQRTLQGARRHVEWRYLVASYAFLPAALLALYTLVQGPAYLEHLIDGPNSVASLAAGYAQLPPLARMVVAPLAIVLFALPMLVILAFYGAHTFGGPTFGWVVGTVIGAIALLAVLGAARSLLHRRAVMESCGRRIRELERNEEILRVQRERAEYRHVVVQLAQAMRS